MRSGFVYIMTNKPHGTLYIGVTADLAQRVWQHRQGGGSAFCRRYNLRMLVHVEESSTIEEAIAREKQLKKWERRWKLELIVAANPDWRDLWEVING